MPTAQAPAALPPGAMVRDAESYALLDYEVDSRLTSGLAMMLIVISTGYCGLAIANSMAMAAHHRRPDAAALRASGATMRQLVATAVGETAVVVGIGAALGLLVTLPPLAGVAAGLSEATSTSVTPRISVSTVGSVIAGCLALAVFATVLVTLGVGRDVSGADRSRRPILQRPT